MEVVVSENQLFRFPSDVREKTCVFYLTGWLVKTLHLCQASNLIRLSHEREPRISRHLRLGERVLRKTDFIFYPLHLQLYLLGNVV